MKSFKEIRENFEVEELDEVDTIPFIASKSFFVITQFHIFHLITKSYSEHIAIGAFYEKLQEATDSLVEKFIGIGGDLDEIDGYSEDFITIYSIDSLFDILEEYRDAISEGIEETTEDELMSLNNQLITIQELIDDLLYKLDLQ